MSGGDKKKWGDLRGVHPWMGGEMTLGEIVKRHKCPAYSEHFIRRAVVDGGVAHPDGFPVWENEMIKRQRDASKRVGKKYRLVLSERGRFA